jgi:replicative DNA helicase
MKEMIMEIDQLLQEITEVTDYLYQQKLKEGYVRLDNTIQKTMKIIEKLFAYKSTAIIDFDENKLINTLTLAMNALEEKDSVLLADLLSLDMAEQLNSIVENL